MASSMEDEDLIVRVYPVGTYALEAIESSAQCMPPRIPPPQASPEHQLSQGSRESTQPPEDNGDDLDRMPYIEHRFSNRPRTSAGFVYGTDARTCDVVLPFARGLSKRHFSFTYKKSLEDGRCYHLIERDLGSTMGTAVGYDSQGHEERRRSYDWIIEGFPFARVVTVHLLREASFRVVVAGHDVGSPRHAAQVERLRQGAADAEDLVAGLGIRSGGPATERNSGAHTPIVQQPVILSMGWIASGAFGVVSRHWNASTGEQYACKRPLKTFDRDSWDNEIDIMRTITHDHIVRLCHWRKTPSPFLYLEYMPLGNLEDQHATAPFSSDECLVIFHQSLTALVYLHSRPLPIAHRDIKPENILVKSRSHSRDPNGLCIKLSDFGLSKTGSLKSFCGTQTYMPPEVRPDDVPYTNAVDIWSLGVVLLRFAHGLPHPGSGMGIEWCEKVAEEAGGWKSEGLAHTLQRMLIIDAEARSSTAACLSEASQLVATLRDHHDSPTAEHNASGDTLVLQGKDVRERETMRPQVHQQHHPGEGASSQAPREAIDWPSPLCEDDMPWAIGDGQRQGFDRSNAPHPSTIRANPSQAPAAQGQHRESLSRRRNLQIGSQYLRSISCFGGPAGDKTPRGETASSGVLQQDLPPRPAESSRDEQDSQSCEDEENEQAYTATERRIAAALLDAIGEDGGSGDEDEGGDGGDNAMDYPAEAAPRDDHKRTKQSPAPTASAMARKRLKQLA